MYLTVYRVVSSIGISNEEIEIEVKKGKLFYEISFTLKLPNLDELRGLSTCQVKIREVFHDRFRECMKDESSEKFYESLIRMLLRYDTISGDVRGYQMALPTGVFQALKKNWGVQHECFASPMNACPQIGSFCSRFKDTDSMFGSKGSFFEFEPEEGSYESNPPFVEECMIRNIVHIRELMDKAEQVEKPLTFFIIVPKWDDATCESYNRTLYGTPDRPDDEEEYDKYYVTKMEIGRNTHFYNNGMTFQDDFSLITARQDSLMIVLQTSKAKEENPVIEKVFKKVISEAWSTRNNPEYLHEECENDNRIRGKRSPNNDYPRNDRPRDKHSHDDYRDKRSHDDYSRNNNDRHPNNPDNSCDSKKIRYNNTHN